MRSSVTRIDVVVGGMLAVWFSWSPCALAHRIQVERPAIDTASHRHRNGAVHDHGPQHSGYPAGTQRATPAGVCLNCDPCPPEVCRPGVGPEPCHGDSCGGGGGKPSPPPPPPLDPARIQAAQRTGRRAVLHGSASSMSIPVDLTTRAEKKQAVAAIRKQAHHSLHSAINGLGRYSEFGHDAGHESIPKLISKKIHEWTQARKEAGLPTKLPKR